MSTKNFSALNWRKVGQKKLVRTCDFCRKIQKVKGKKGKKFTRYGRMEGPIEAAISLSPVI